MLPGGSTAPYTSYTTEQRSLFATMRRLNYGGSAALADKMEKGTATRQQIEAVIGKLSGEASYRAYSDMGGAGDYGRSAQALQAMLDTGLPGRATPAAPGGNEPVDRSYEPFVAAMEGGTPRAADAGGWRSRSGGRGRPRSSGARTWPRTTGRMGSAGSPTFC